MSDEPGDDDPRAAIAAAFERPADPLADHAPTFETLAVDPFDVFLTETLAAREPAPNTVRSYDRLIEQWRSHMATTDRHPACPNETHVRGFVSRCLEERANQPGTVRTKLRRLAGILDAWQGDPVFPHPDDYNPFERVLEASDLSRSLPKEPPRIPVAELRRILGQVSHLRDRLVLALQLKLGLRASELVNLELQDCTLDAPAVAATHSSFATHHAVADRSNAVYVASRYERAKNKSHRPRVLPLDTELQRLLRRYLKVRPTAATDALVLTKSTHNPIQAEYVARIWRETFHPEYAETGDHRAVTSHFGRHRFTTHWRVSEDVPRPLVKYMRGDSPADDPFTSTDAIDAYIHAYYEDIKSVYCERIYKLDL